MKWPAAKIGDICDVVSGATPKTGNPAFWNGDIPWATPKDLSELDQKYLRDTPRKITVAGLKSCAATLLPANSVLLSSRAPIGLVAINTTPVATNQGFKSLVPAVRKVNTNYLYWWLITHRSDLERRGRGATFKEVSKKIVEDVEIPLPPLAEQKRIAGILDAADALRAKRRKSIEQLDALLQATFLDMFGDPVANPKGWVAHQLESVVEKITDGTHHSPPITESGIPYITAKHLKKNGIRFFDDPWYISEEDHVAIYSRCNPEKGDVLYIKDGVTTGIAAVNRYDFPFSMLSSVALLKVNLQHMHPEYLCAWLNNERNKSILLGNMGGAAIKRLTLAKIKRFSIPLPPIGQQNKYAEIVDGVTHMREHMENHVSLLDELFSSLQHRAFNGEL